MPMLVKNIVLNKMEWASVVDRGASGDDAHRPRIVLWKRSTDTPNASWIEKAMVALRIKKGGNMPFPFPPKQPDAATAQPGQSPKPTPPAKPAGETHIHIHPQGSAPQPNDSASAKPVVKSDDIGAPAIDSLGLSDAQKKAVLQLLAAAKGPGKEIPMAEGGETRNPVANPSAEPMGAAVQADIVKRDAQIVELEKRATESEKKVKELGETLALVEFRKRADALPNLPEKPETIALILKRASDAGDKDLPVMLEKINKAMVESPLFKAYGSGRTNDSSASGELEAKALELRKQDPKMTKAAAITKASELHPDLYAKAREENAAA